MFSLLFRILFLISFQMNPSFAKKIYGALTAFSRSLPLLITHHLLCPHDGKGQAEAEGVSFWFPAGQGLNSSSALCYSLNEDFITKW